MAKPIGDVENKYLRYTPPSLSPGKEGSFKRAMNRINNCTLGHSKCPRATAGEALRRSQRRDTLEDRSNGFLDSDLSQTLQDAVTVTREFGFQYIWIDSLLSSKTRKQTRSASCQKWPITTSTPP